MADFTKHPCWDEETVTATVATEAVSPSHNVFLATHAPLDIHRTTLLSGQAGAVRVVSEHDVFADFVNRPTNKGVLVMPVIGESGAGKSHLVRWVHAQTATELSADRYRVVYLPKDGTSLAGVVERLLMGHEGSQFDDIRADLGRLSRNVTHEALQHDILDKLAAALLVASPTSPRERALAGEFGLRALLVDPFVRPKILRPDGLIARRAEHILHGRGESGGDVPMDFTADDLPLDMVDFDKASEPARTIFRKLASSEGLQTAAFTMLAHHLDVAVMEATNLGVGRVAKAFLDIRRALAGKQEIVLLVEDFALVQGVQRDLIDAITETGERLGEQTLAPIRALMAVTSGYFQDLPPTARTRIDAATPYQYRLEVNLDRDGAGDRVTDLLGRYLNAARVGRAALDAADVRTAGSVPNACDPCPFREECHSGFGASSDGYGLYPYNRPALLRVLRATAAPDRPGEFNPRAALARVVRGVLQEHAADIRNGAFPNEVFEERFPRANTGTVVPTVVQAAINQADPQDAVRRQVLLQYWGDAPSQLMNLPDAVHTAFALPALIDLSVPNDTAAPTDFSVRPDERAEKPARQGTLERKLARIEDWQARSAPMLDDEAREIRGVIREAILSAVSWTDPLMKEPSADLLEKAWPKQLMARIVSIEGASETRAHGVEPLMRFERTPENALFFAGLLKLAAGRRDGTLTAALRLREIAWRDASVARSAVVETAERGDGAVVAALRVSLTGAALAGVVAPGDAPDELLSAAVARLGNHRRSDADGRAALWTRYLNEHLAERDELVLRLREAIGTAQGTSGGVHAIDATRALRLVAVAAAREWEPGTDVPRWARKAARPLADGRVEAAVAAQLEALTGLLERIRSRLPAGTGLRETVKAVTTAFEAAERATMVPVPDLPQIRERNAAASDLRSAPVDSLERDLDRLEAGSRADRLRIAAIDRGPDLTRIHDYLVASETWLDAGLGTPLGTRSGETRQLVDDLAEARDRWAGIAATLAGGKA